MNDPSSRYIFSVRRYVNGSFFTVEKTMTDTELDALAPAIIKDIFWKMVQQMMEIKQ